MDVLAEYCVYGSARTRSTRVLWTLEELGIPYRYVPMDLRSGAHLQPQFRTLNPGGRVPVLTADDFVLTESVAICVFLSEQHPDAGLLPPGATAKRALVNQWLSFVVTELEQPLWTLAKHTYALPPDMRVPAMLEIAPREWARAAATLSSALSQRPYLVGGRFSLADLLVGHTLAWARGFNLRLGPPNLEAFADRVLARPAFARARARETQDG